MPASRVPLLPRLRRPARAAPAEAGRTGATRLHGVRVRPSTSIPKVAVGTIIRTVTASIVLVQRAIEPGYGKWVFPGGYVDRGEELLGAAAARGARGMRTRRAPRRAREHLLLHRRDADHHRLRGDGAVRARSRWTTRASRRRLFDRERRSRGTSWPSPAPTRRCATTWRRLALADEAGAAAAGCPGRQIRLQPDFGASAAGRVANTVGAGQSSPATAAAREVSGPVASSRSATISSTRQRASTSSTSADAHG